MSTIIGLSFVAPATARLACTLVACAGLALLTPAPASRHLEASTGPGVVECQTPADRTGDREWTNDVSVSMSDACDDDGDESSSASGLMPFDREHVAPRFTYGARLVGLTDARRGARERDAHLLRGPPASAQRSSDLADDDTAGTHPSRSGRGSDHRAPHVHFLRDPFRSAVAASDYLLRAPP